MSLCHVRFRRLLKPRFSRCLFGDRDVNPIKFDYRIAMIRDIDPSLGHSALTMNPTLRANLNLNIALQQHNELLAVMEALGLEIHKLESDGYADSVFIEDTAVIIGSTALIARPGAESRRGETGRVEEYIRTYFPDMQVRTITNGILDGGDILFTGGDVHNGGVILAGKTSRTDSQGIAALQEAFHACKVISVDMEELYRIQKTQQIHDVVRGINIGDGQKMLHLKSFCSMYAPGVLLVGGSIGLALHQFLQKENIFARTASSSYLRPTGSTWRRGIDIVAIPDSAAANCVHINGTVLRRTDQEYPDSAAVFAQLRSNYPSIQQIQLDGSELAKVDGALTCCSLLW